MYVDQQARAKAPGYAAWLEGAAERRFGAHPTRYARVAAVTCHAGDEGHDSSLRIAALRGFHC